MDNSGVEMCVICHDLMETNIYSLPECAHQYHTNCILHWFRAGHNKCPLCNNVGVNGESDLYWGMQDNLALDNYKKMRRFATRKNAPLDLKKQIRKVKRLEKKNEKKKALFKNFKNEVPSNGKTRKQLQLEWRRAAVKWNSYRLRRELKHLKVAIGIQYIKPIIIATKVDL